jgi:hypothetical protein
VPEETDDEDDEDDEDDGDDGHDGDHHDWNLHGTERDREIARKQTT